METAPREEKLPAFCRLIAILSTRTGPARVRCGPRERPYRAGRRGMCHRALIDFQAFPENRVTK